MCLYLYIVIKNYCVCLRFFKDKAKEVYESEHKHTVAAGGANLQVIKRKRHSTLQHTGGSCALSVLIVVADLL